MAMSPDDMVPSGPSSAGQQAVIAYLQKKGVPVNAGTIRQAVEQNARDPGSMEANGPNLGPVVLNLRNAGIEDASPMPARGGGGRTSALPTPPVPPQPPADRTVEPSLPSDRVDGYIPTPGPIPPTGGEPIPGGMPGGGQLPPRAGDPVTQSPPPQLPPPPAGAAATPPLGPDVLAGRSLMDLLRYAGQQLTAPQSIPALRMPMTPEVGRQITGPPPVPQVEGPPPRLALPAPAAVPQISGPAPRLMLPAPEGTNIPRLPAPQPNLMDVPGFKPEIPTQAPSPVGASISKSLEDPPIQQAPVKSRKRAGRR